MLFWNSIVRFSTVYSVMLECQKVGFAWRLFSSLKYTVLPQVSDWIAMWQDLQLGEDTNSAPVDAEQGTVQDVTCLSTSAVQAASPLSVLLCALFPIRALQRLR